MNTRTIAILLLLSACGSGTSAVRTTRATSTPVPVAAEEPVVDPVASPVASAVAAVRSAVPTLRPRRTPTPKPATPAPTPAPTGQPSQVRVGDCSVFPADNPWNTDISGYPVHANSANWIAAISGDLHPDFGSPREYGIPYVVVGPQERKWPVNFTAYGDESDPGPYPVPLDAPIEGGQDADDDRHAIAVQTGDCKLYEMYRAFPRGDRWDADSGAVFDLNSNKLRPEKWTSADAAGLPVFAGLVRYDEVQAGAIRHALRFTVRRTQRGYIHPATHYASSSTDPNLPPMGMRVRLKASFDMSRFTGASRVVLEALKRYGMMVADNGSDWFITGATDPRWDDDDLNQLKSVSGTNFEVVDTGEIRR